MKRFLIIALLYTSCVAFAQNGSVTGKQLNIIREAYIASDASTKALTNALSNNDINKLVLSRQNLQGVEHSFKYKVKVSGISDQKKSGRCWMFTSMNVIRPMVIEKYNLASFEFSQNYLYFWDIFEKANLYLEAQIKYATKPIDDKYVEWLFKNPVSDGGVWSSFTNLADKYGLVPKDVFPESNTSENTRSMITIIKRKLREDGLILRALYAKKIKYNELEAEKIKMLGDIYKILAMNLGEPPTEFDYRFTDKKGKLAETKLYTPIKFMNEVLDSLNFESYIMLMNDPTHEYNKVYEIEYDRNVMEGRNWVYLNLSNDQIKKYAIKSIKNNMALYASCDVGKQLNSALGYADVDNYDYESLYGVKFEMDKAQRIKTFDSGSSHGMALIAVDVDDNEKPIKWQFENSWGVESGHKGYLTFTDDWFNEYMFRVVVHKDFVNPETLKLLEQKPVMLPPWDPMFQADE